MPASVTGCGFRTRALFRIKQRPWDTSKNCSKSAGLTPRQMKLCKDNLDLMPTVVHSALLSVETCQKQFSDRRWNCSSVLKVPTLTKDLVRGKKKQKPNETGLIQSVQLT
ncbi:hypothetical protein Btru_049837 [Bulinus truncatus]|nr:hypothetical protein Btru_049837 [Bulinus truncatus]